MTEKTNDKYSTYREELGLNVKFPEEQEQIKHDIAQGKYNKDELVEKLYDKPIK